MRVFAFVVCAGASFKASGQGSSAGQQYAARGLELAQAGDLKNAEDQLRRAIELSPDNSAFLADLGKILGMQHRFEESNTYFEKALKIDPTNVAVRRDLAANQWQSGHIKEAKQNLDLVLKSSPGDEPTVLLLGMVSENLKDYARAARLLESVPGLVRQRPESIAALARSYYRTGQKQRARDTLGTLLVRPEGPEGVFLGGQIASQEGDDETALKLLTSIKSSYADPAKLAYSIAEIQYHANHFRECQDALLDLIVAGYATSDVYNLLAWCYYRQRKYQETVRAFDQAIDLEPTKESNYLDLGRTLLEHHLYPVALAVAKQGVERMPNSYRAYMLKGMVEAKQGDLTGAVKSYSKAIELNPASPEANFNLGRVQWLAGMIPEAEATFERGTKRFPHDALTYQEYALMLLRRSETGDSTVEPRAVSLLEAAMAQDPSLSEPHYQLGNLWLGKGKVAAALEELERAKKLDPRSSKVHFALSRAYRRGGRTEDASHELELYQKLKTEEDKASAAFSLEPRR